MLKVNGQVVDINKFPDGTLLMKQPFDDDKALIFWRFENNEELVALIYLTRHLRDRGVRRIHLLMPYIPNARQDRVKNNEDVFTLKHFAWVINSLELDKVIVLDPHSSVSEALLNNIEVMSPAEFIKQVYDDVVSHFDGELIMFYPDEGAMKRYSGMMQVPYAFGIKNREWSTGKIKGLSVASDGMDVAGKNVLIVDDISSRGGTFYYSAKKLKELGANKIFLYITHCENTILDGDVLTSGLIEKVYTTDSLFTNKHEMIEVIEL